MIPLESEIKKPQIKQDKFFIAQLKKAVERENSTSSIENNNTIQLNLSL